jgi:hypothetical protein
MEKVVVFGIHGDDATVNTMDTCKSRSFSDVVYRSDYFRALSLSNDKIKAVSKMCENALKFMWTRTHYMKEALYVKVRTHAEGLEFLDNHLRLIDAIGAIYTENTKGEKEEKKAIGRYFPPGYASAMLYLMGSSTSDYNAYKDAGFNESALNWDNWDKALEFWVLLGSRDVKLRSVYTALGYLADPESGVGGSLAEKTAIVAKGWKAYLENGEITDEDVQLTYVTDEDDVRHLMDYPTVGGIDLGEPERKKASDDEEEGSEVDPTPEQLEERKKAVRDDKEAEREAKRKDLQEKLQKRRKAGKYKTPENGEEPKAEEPVKEVAEEATE